MTKTNEKPIESMNFEEAFEELEKTVEKMESNEGTLEESMEAFTRGQALIKRCAELLDKAELKVKQLSGENLDEPLEAG